MDNSHVHPTFEKILNNAFSHVGEASFYPSYFDTGEGHTFKGFVSNEVMITVVVGPYCNLVAVSPHNAEDRENAKKWEHISELYFNKRMEEAQKRIAAFVSQPERSAVS